MYSFMGVRMSLSRDNALAQLKRLNTSWARNHISKLTYISSGCNKTRLYNLFAMYRH